MLPFAKDNFMKALDNVNEILQKFGASISLPQLALDKDNTCVLKMDDAQNIQLTYNEANETLYFFSEIGNLPEKNEVRCCSCLLKSNAEWELTEGMTLSKKENASTIIMGYRLPVLNLTLEFFEKILENFVSKLDIWKDYVQQMSQGQLPEALAEL